MNDKTLFEPYKLESLTLSNRVAMAALTRNRAGKGFVPSEFAATYYSQKASSDLLISEATQVSQQGQGYQEIPEGSITTPDLLAKTPVTNISAQAPHLSSDDAKTRQQATNAVNESLMSLVGQTKSEPLVQPADIQKKAELTNIKNPAEMVWRSLMLAP